MNQLLNMGEISEILQIPELKASSVPRSHFFRKEGITQHRNFPKVPHITGQGPSAAGWEKGIQGVLQPPLPAPGRGQP